MNQCQERRRRGRILRPALFLAACSPRIASLAILAFTPTLALAAGGVLTLITGDDTTDRAVPARLELRNESGRRTAVRRTIASGPGVVLPSTLEIPLSNGQYRFRVVRGPEYRVVTGQFAIEPAAADERLVPLSRMVDMQAEGYLSGDMAAFSPLSNLRLRMAAEDLHVAALIDPPPQSPSRPGAGEPRQQADLELSQDDSQVAPLWFNRTARRAKDLLVYRSESAIETDADASDATLDDDATADTPTGAGLAGDVPGRGEPSPFGPDQRIAIANPFGWELPLHLATGRIDGIFVLGDWLREGAKVDKIKGARPPADIGFTGPLGPGRYAESIYHRLMEAGFRVVPLAGTGTAATSGNVPAADAWSAAAIGYNRVYGIGPPKVVDDDRRVDPLGSEAAFYAAVWAGRTVLTNGPCLRPTLGGRAPGHTFQARSGQSLEMSVELHLAVRDPVDYLEVVHNGEVFYSARLDEFAATGGVIPPLKIDRSGWVMVRVATDHEEHFRVAMSAPWFIDFDDRRRISRKAVDFFGKWLADCETELKKLPPDELKRYIGPVRAAREFWRQRVDEANAD